MLKPEGIGRDKFENWALTLVIVLVIQEILNVLPTHKGFYITQIALGLELQSINHVWQTDITYIYVNGRFYYLTFIIDIYSQRIVGYKASKNLFAKANIDCLKMALRLRGISKYSKLIHHSDKGSQYIATKYLDLLKHHNIQ